MSNSSYWVLSIVSCPLLVGFREGKRFWVTGQPADRKDQWIDAFSFFSFFSLFIFFWFPLQKRGCARETSLRDGFLGFSLSQVRMHPPYICPGTEVQYLRSSQQSVFILGIVSLSKWRCSGSCSGHKNVPSGIFQSLIIFTGGVSEVLVRLQTKMSECVVVCRQNWKKCLISQPQVRASWEKMKSGSPLVMSKQLAAYHLQSHFSPSGKQ